MAKRRRAAVAVAAEMDPAEWQRSRGRAMVEEAAEVTAGGMPVGKVRVCLPPVELYLRRGQITARMCAAARRLRDDYDLGICGARDPERKGGTAAGEPMSAAQLMAARAYAKAVQAVGPRLSVVLLATVCEELWASEIGARVGERRDGVMALLRAGLDALADHYEPVGMDPR